MSPKPTTKRCTKCGVEKPLTEFHRHRTGRRRACKPCRCKAAREGRARRAALPPPLGKTPKRCKKCEELKPPGEFSFGHSVCKACRAIRSRQWHVDNRERVAANGRRYNAANREVMNAAQRLRNSKYPQKQKARMAVFKAVLKGTLVRKSCEGCGAPPGLENGTNRITAHHHKGYDEEFWLDVQWLCRACHAAKHHKHPQ